MITTYRNVWKERAGCLNLIVFLWLLLFCRYSVVCDCGISWPYSLFNWKHITYASIIRQWKGMSVHIWMYKQKSGCFCLFDLTFYIQVSNFSVILGRVFLGWSSTKLRIKCLAQGHKAVLTVRLKPTIPRSWVKHSTTEPLRSHYNSYIFPWNWDNLVSKGDSCESLEPPLDSPLKWMLYTSQYKCCKIQLYKNYSIVWMLHWAKEVLFIA